MIGIPTQEAYDLYRDEDGTIAGFKRMYSHVFDNKTLREFEKNYKKGKEQEKVRQKEIRKSLSPKTSVPSRARS